MGKGGRRGAVVIVRGGILRGSGGKGGRREKEGGVVRWGLVGFFARIF